MEVEQASPAAQAGLAVGDVVLSVTRRRVRSIEELEDALRGNESMLLLQIARGARKLLLVLRRMRNANTGPPRRSSPPIWRAEARR